MKTQNPNEPHAILDHVAVAVRSIDEALPFYRDLLGLVLTEREEVPSQGVRTAFLGREDALIELLEPISEGGPVAEFLRKRGPGLHHVAFSVPDIAAASSRLARAGKPTIDEKPRPGARGLQVCFIHPKNCGGVLVELVEGR